MIFSLQDGKHFYQWDRERVLVVNDSEIDQVHFTNEAITQAIIKDVYTVDGVRLVDVPTYLLQCACNLTAYAYKVETPEREYTIIHETFRVIARKQPNDYIPPEEHDKWVEVRKEILEALEQSKTAAAAAASDKEHAETSAQNAKESETNAVQSASAAAEYAESIKSSVEAAEKSASDAKLSAESAAASASAAGNYATAAGASENNASASESNAKSYMESAGQSATSASASKEAAKTSETNAAASASSAAISKTSAENSAKAAKTSETNAASSASTAAEKATEAAASAASSKASEESASESANTATAKALEAAASATVSAENKAAAALSEQNAAASAGNASDNATAAGNSASAAAESANTANSAASTATTKANAAASSASAAASSESAAKMAQTAAEDAKTKAEAARDQAQEIAGGDYVTKSEIESKGYLTEHQDISGKANVSDLTAHTGNSTIHVTAAEKEAWNAKSNFSGSYNELSDKPDIPDQLSDLLGDATHRTVTDTEKAAWNAKSDFSGNYADLSNKPTIPTVPTNVSAFTNDAGYITEHQDISGKANVSDLTAHTGNNTVHVTAAEKAAWNGKSDFSGNYSDLTNKPDIPDQLSDLTSDATHRTVTDAEKSSWNGKSNFSGNYADLTNKPTIPTVPTNVSAFANDAGYLTEHQDISGKANALDLTAHTGNNTVHVPSVTASDAGKILMVDSSGSWVAMAITNAEGVSY